VEITLMRCRRAIHAVLLTAALCLAAGSLHASDCCDPASPFREGEGYADKPATCENLRYWAERAPNTNDRVSMAVKGKLSGVHWNGVLAYLEMCDPKGLRVVCVTYETNGMQAGEVVSFGGGLASTSKEWVMLDPCLASR
jgi:hypothetical protein